MSRAAWSSVALPVLILWDAQAVGQSSTSNVPDCSIGSLPTGRTVEIWGEIQASAKTTGKWSLAILKNDSGGRSMINQSGRFETNADGIAAVGGVRLSLEKDGEVVAEMSLSLANGQVDCDRVIKGHE